MIHAKDIRLANNAGMSFPVCQANAKLLDLGKSAWRTTSALTLVTCGNCKRIWPKRYSWMIRAK